MAEDMSMSDTLEFFAEEYIRKMWGVEIHECRIVRVPQSTPSFRFPVRTYEPPKLLPSKGWWAKVQRFLGRLIRRRGWGFYCAIPTEELVVTLMQLHLWIPDALGLLHYVIDAGYARPINTLILSEFKLMCPRRKG